MAAPALVALAHGSRDPRSAATIKALVDEVKAMRPDLKVEAAFLELLEAVLPDGRRPAGQGRPRRDRRRTAAAHRGLPRQGRRAERRRRGDAAPPGRADPRDVDPRPGAALPRGARRADARGAEASRVRELDALVLAAAGSSDPLANQAVARLARVWGARHKLPVTAAYASAVPAGHRRGRPRVPRRGPPAHRRRLALPGPGLPAGPGRRAGRSRPAPIAVSEPLGAHPELARTILARYAVGAVELVPV